MAILTRLYLPRVHEGRFRYYGSYAIIDLSFSIQVNTNIQIYQHSPECFYVHGQLFNGQLYRVKSFKVFFYIMYMYVNGAKVFSPVDFFREKARYNTK